jgi:hypothetical protein
VAAGVKTYALSLPHLLHNLHGSIKLLLLLQHECEPDGNAASQNPIITV